MATTIQLPLPPTVLEKLRILQNADRPVSVNEILMAANLKHLITDTTQHPVSYFQLEKSTSSALTERRRLPASPEKLRLYSQITSDKSHRTVQGMLSLRKLEEENAKLPIQDSEEYMLAHLEKQNALLNADPKAISIESNRLQADFNTIRNLVTDATYTPAHENHEQAIQAILAKKPIKKQDDDCSVDSEDDTVDNKEISDWDFWQALVDDYPTATAKLPHLLAAKLKYGGIPHSIRGVIWQAMAQSSSLNLETIYARLSEDTEISSYDRVIQRDLSRTFPQLEMFKADGGEGQMAMGRLLKAYSLYDAHVGYCQGLGFVVGPLLMTMTEEQAFCVFVRLMETYEMRTMFTLNMEGLHLRLHQFQTLLSQLCPLLDAHFQHHSIHPAMYASQWYLTLFAYSFPISLVLRIYDLVFAEGAVETITRVAIAFMKKNEDTLLEIDNFEELMMYLSSRKLYEIAYNSDPEPVIHDAMSLSTVITKQKMDSISDSYNKEAEQEKNRVHQLLAIRFSQWGKNKKTSRRDSWFPWGGDTSTASNEKRHSISNISTVSSTANVTPVSTPGRTVETLHQQIEDLVTALSQLQKENSQQSEEILAKNMVEMDLIKERDDLKKKNRQLEHRMKKMEPMNMVTADQLSPLESVDGDCITYADSETLKYLQDKPEFIAFMDSLKKAGHFDDIISHLQYTDSEDEHLEQDTMKLTKVRLSNEGTHGYDDVTSELLSLKLANFEMGLKYQALCEDHEQLTKKLIAAQEGQTELSNKIMDLHINVESLQIDKEHLLQERDDLMKQNEEWKEKAMTAKKTAADLQMEKIILQNENETLQMEIKGLEDGKTVASDSMEEEASTGDLFTPDRPVHMGRRHTVQLMPFDFSGSYQSKYIESDMRCRELEILLAEAKVKLAEYEASQPSMASPRPSTQNSRRASIQTKRSSLSLYVKSTIAPSDTRKSTDSMASINSTSSQITKRSSVYFRFLNAISASPGSDAGNGSYLAIRK
ncbi:rab-GTPase-TBC domain-containing protein [Pilobolus umbonatus]|nr:rab-GTPase-TBC domain-containing protein [Pilobolus umbonatus]